MKFINFSKLSSKKKITIKKKIYNLIKMEMKLSNEKIFKDDLLNILFKNPLNFLKFILSPSNLFKNIKPPKKYLQLFHLINLNLKNIKKKKKYSLINNLHRKVVKSKYEGIYVLYKNTNFIAKKYYHNNNFKIYDKNLFYSLAVKKFQF